MSEQARDLAQIRAFKWMRKEIIEWIAQVQEWLKKIGLDCLVVDEGSVKDSERETNNAS